MRLRFWHRKKITLFPADELTREQIEELTDQFRQHLTEHAAEILGGSPDDYVVRDMLPHDYSIE